MTDCKHWDGDTVNGYWVCAKCYAKLADRPRSYRMVKKERSVNHGDVFLSDQPKERQEVVFAPVAEAQGYTLSQFIEAMARRLIARTGGSFSKHDANDYAIEIMRNLDEPFGSSDLDWTSAGARELVDEDLQHWDADENASN